MVFVIKDVLFSYESSMMFFSVFLCVDCLCCLLILLLALLCCGFDALFELCAFCVLLLSLCSFGSFCCDGFSCVVVQGLSLLYSYCVLLCCGFFNTD